jgi:preprotein translocase subunit SecF
MLGRTVITSGTAVLSMLPFLIWGTNSLQDFAYVLIIGFLTGTMTRSTFNLRCPLDSPISYKIISP